MKKTVKKSPVKKQVFDLSTIDVKSLKEFNGFEDAQKALVKENKFIKAENHKTYEAAKKAAHALLKGRTGLEAQEKIIVKTLQGFRKDIGAVTAELISITQPHEIKQKEEIHAYENKKELERQAKAEAEAKKLEDIRNTILGIESHIMEHIDRMEYETISATSKKILENTNAIDGSVFGELEDLYDDTILLLREKFNTKKRGLTVAYEQAKREEELAAREAQILKEREEMEAARLELAKADIVVRRNKHIIQLMKAGFKEADENVFTKPYTNIALISFTDRGGMPQYETTDEDVQGAIDFAQKMEYRTQTLDEFKDLLSDDLYNKIMLYEDNDFQIEINGLVDKKNKPNDQIFVTEESNENDPKAAEKIAGAKVLAKFEELQKIDVNEIEVVEPIVLSGKTIEIDISDDKSDEEKLTLDKVSLLKSLDSFGLDFIPEIFETEDGAAYMNIIFDRFEQTKKWLQDDINANF